MGSNFAALWPTDSMFSAIKDLNPFKIVWKVQEASSHFRMVFACLNWPHLHRAYVVTVPFILILAVQPWTFTYTWDSLINVGLHFFLFSEDFTSYWRGRFIRFKGFFRNQKKSLVKFFILVYSGFLLWLLNIIYYVNKDILCGNNTP